MEGNSVSLVGWYGGDRAIARAAWTSTQIDVDAKSDEQVRDLIVNKLWNNSSGKPHKTPFERGIVEFNITCDQASHIHLLKHRHANINGESARYKELKEDKMLIPDDWGSIYCSELEDIQEEFFIDFNLNGNYRNLLTTYTQLGNRLYHQAVKDATEVLGRKRAKESARFFKTMNSQITLSVMMNMSCFHNFYTLRADEAAQKEIRDIANMMVDSIAEIEGNPFKYTLEAWGV